MYKAKAFKKHSGFGFQDRVFAAFLGLILWKIEYLKVLDYWQISKYVDPLFQFEIKSNKLKINLT